MQVLQDLLAKDCIETVVSEVQPISRAKPNR